jgi:hypothetical protein
LLNHFFAYSAGVSNQHGGNFFSVLSHQLQGCWTGKHPDNASLPKLGHQANRSGGVRRPGSFDDFKETRTALFNGDKYIIAEPHCHRLDSLSQRGDALACRLRPKSLNNKIRRGARRLRPALSHHRPGVPDG